MIKEYDHKKAEKHWQKEWEKEKLYEIKDGVKDKENFYQLVEFPYPSGNLHVGHWYAFSVPDIFVRAKKMQGFNVLYPIGFDAFGLPAENAAIERGLNPREWTKGNIEYMEEQLRTMGASFDWSRSVETSDPEYYKWTQWMFLELFKKDLAYQGETLVNWCPSCKTVLANEQVVQGQCERCGHEVEQRVMKQWMMKISEYAERLLRDLEALDWPEAIKEGQRNWIGKKVGAEIEFRLTTSRTVDAEQTQTNAEKDQRQSASSQRESATIKVFTTRPDTIYGATYMVVAPESGVLSKIKDRLSNLKEVEDYIKKAGKKTELQRMAEGKNKTGVELKGVMAINPATKEEIPVWVADYVLGSVGTGAIMAVPAHDARDYEFAKKFGLRIRQVIKPPHITSAPESSSDASASAFGHLDTDLKAEVWTGDGVLVDSGEFNGEESQNVRNQMAEKFGKSEIQYRMRDWVISRQRYWGVPIPIIHCEKCGAVADDKLPVELPDMKDFKPKGDGKGPLARAEKWVKVKCPECDGDAEREADTMDTFVDSSWYFLRYLDPKNKKEFASQGKLQKWMPVDRYSGGAEHTTMHLLYSRFWIKALYDLGHLKWSEPYEVRMNRSLILGPDGQKMSKSRGNVIDPDEYVEKLGADTVRMYLAFIGPYNEVGSYPWDAKGIQGIRRFLERVWRFFQDSKFASESSNNNIHKTVKKVTEDAEAFKFNTAIAALMSFLNQIEKETMDKETASVFLKLLAPFAPHMTEEIWREVLGHGKSIHLEKWPEYDESLIKDETLKIPVQINGKVRAILEVDVGISEDEVKKSAEAEKNVQIYIKGKEVKKFVYVEGKIINFVVK